MWGRADVPPSILNLDIRLRRATRSVHKEGQKTLSSFTHRYPYGAVLAGIERGCFLQRSQQPAIGPYCVLYAGILIT